MTVKQERIIAKALLACMLLALLGLALSHIFQLPLIRTIAMDIGGFGMALYIAAHILKK